MAKRVFLQLAHPYNPKKHTPLDWLASEKLDGIRCYWDGGVTRGLWANEVPWANVDKDARYLERVRSTGLWTRYGKTVQAPDWWLDKLPLFPLDGELFVGRKGWQRLSSIVKAMKPGIEWQDVKYMVFHSPPTDIMFSVGEINELHYKKAITPDVVSWIRGRVRRTTLPGTTPAMRFSEVYAWLLDSQIENRVVSILPQPQMTWPVVQEYAAHIESEGGEGVMLANPGARWVPQRTHNLIKLKSSLDSEGVVIGYHWGKETDKGSKLLGKMGNLILEFPGPNGPVTFELSGFTDDERRIIHRDTEQPPNDQYARSVAGKTVSTPDWICPAFPLGERVSFKYRELSDSGIPKEARYWRKRTDQE
jgi:DNA ligase-1